MNFNKQFLLPLASVVTSIANPGYRFANNNQDCWLSASLNVLFQATTDRGNKLIDLITSEVDQAAGLTQNDKNDFLTYFSPAYLESYRENGDELIPHGVIKNIRKCMFQGIAHNRFLAPINGNAYKQNPNTAFTEWFGISYPNNINVQTAYNTGNDQVVIFEGKDLLDELSAKTYNAGNVLNIIKPFINAQQNNRKVEHVLFLNPNHLVQEGIYDQGFALQPSQLKDTVQLGLDVYELVGFCWSAGGTWQAYLKDDANSRWVKTHVQDKTYIDDDNNDNPMIWWDIDIQGGFRSDFANALYKRRV